MTPALLEHLTAEEREAWKLAQEATPGPLQWDGDPCNRDPEYREENAPWLTSTVTGSPVLLGDIFAASNEDRDFIAASRTALPAALLALAEARMERDEARRALGESAVIDMQEVQDACEDTLPHAAKEGM